MFVERDQGGQVVGVYTRRQPDRAEEELPAAHADIVAFKSATAARAAARAEQARKLGTPADALLAIVGWIEANPGTMTPAMQAVIDGKNAT